MEPDGRTSTLPVAAVATMTRAVVDLAAERSVDDVLAALLESARTLVGARWAALGIPAEEGDTFARFLTAGMDDELVARLGDLPRRHGLLATMLTSPRPLRLDDLHDHPDFAGAWPSAHPDMRAFLGVPIQHGTRLLGALYLANATRGSDDPTGGFTAEDQVLVELLAAHAAVAIEHARREEAAVELHTVAARERIAADLHDALGQALAGAGFAVEATVAHVDAARDAVADGPASAPLEAAASGLADVRSLLATSRRELAAVIAGTRPHRLAQDGLGPTLRFRMDLLARARGIPVVGEVADVDLDDDVEVALLRIAEEAMSNAVRHAQAGQVEVRLSDDPVELVVRDDGRGFDPTDPLLRARHLGLTTMRARARSIDATFELRSAPGHGTTVTVRRADGGGAR